MKYGFIGTGNMGSALAKALVKAVEAKEVLLSDHFPEKAEALAKELGAQSAANQEVALRCESIFLGVKPQILPDVLKELAPILRQQKPLLISMAAGVEIGTIEELLGDSLPIIRIMPNTPVALGQGMVLYCCNRLVSSPMLTSFLQDMRFAGRLDFLEESLIDAGCAVSGCGPAYMYLFAEALADGAVACGLSRDKAMIYAAQTMAGAAAMLLETGKHPGALKDAVCSPAGSTIEGVSALEEGGFRACAIRAVKAGFEKNRALGKKK